MRDLDPAGTERQCKLNHLADPVEYGGGA